MASTRPTRSTSLRRPGATSKGPSAKTAPDDLADKVKNKLRMTESSIKGKGKASAQPKTPEEERSAAMQAVNEASKKLTELMQSGWKATAAPTTPKDRRSSEVDRIARSARSRLQALRGMHSGNVDLERAAISIVGKLIALELYTLAIELLTDMHPYMIMLSGSSPKSRSRSTADSLYLLSLPIPAGDAVTTDVTILTLVSSYLLHTLMALAYTEDMESTSLALAAADGGSLLHWASTSYFCQLPPKHLDLVLNRAYSTLTKVTVSVLTRSSSHEAAFRLRVYSLSCLVRTTLTGVTANSFWEQAVRFAAAYTRADSPGTSKGDPRRKATAECVYESFEHLVELAKGRESGEAFMSGRGWVKFCEFWMSMAQTKGDVSALDAISRSLGRASSPSDNRDLHEPDVDDGTGDTKKKSRDESADTFALEGARLYAELSKATTVLESSSFTDAKYDLKQASRAIEKCKSFLRLDEDLGGNENEETRLSRHRTMQKVQNALNNLRRAAVHALEDSANASDARQVLESIISMLEASLENTPTSETLSRALDTLVALSKSYLKASEVGSYGPAFDLLNRANSLLSNYDSDSNKLDALDPLQYATYLRYLSATFYNSAATLYQANRGSAAIRFLEPCCKLGTKAMALYTGLKSEEQDQEAWKAWKAHLYRKWELLGVCYTGMSDRKSACNAFIECIKAFPFADDESYLTSTRAMAPTAVFETSPPIKHIRASIDRVSYIATCELFRDPAEVSLRVTLEDVLPADDTAPCMIGAVLERQIDGLRSSRWKDNVQAVISTLLADALLVYDTTQRPIRRARVLLRCLEFSYHSGETGAQIMGRQPDEIGEEIEKLLSRTDLGYDSNFAPLLSQHLASSRLWRALHTHRRGDPMQTVLVPKYAEEACDALKALTMHVEVDVKDVRSPRVSNIAKRAPARAAGGRATVTKRTTKVPTRTAKKDPVTPKRRKAPQTAAPAAPISTEIKPPLEPREDARDLLTLLQMTIQLLGLQGHVLLKVRVLNVTRRFSERYMEPASDGYISASMDLAHEYAKLGKTERACRIYVRALNVARNQEASKEVQIKSLLRHAESLACSDNILNSSSAYCEAMGLAERLSPDEKGLSALERVRMRVGQLERAALALTAFSMIQNARNDPTLSIDALLQSLRLWDRAADCVLRLNPPKKSQVNEDANPFDMSGMKDALPDARTNLASRDSSATRTSLSTQTTHDGLGWRVAEGHLSTLFALAQAYYVRGSPRVAQYYVERALDMATQLNTPASISRALARKGEIQLHLGELEKGYENLMRAAESLEGMTGPDVADVRRLCGDYSRLSAKEKDAQQLYDEAVSMLDQLGQMFSRLEASAPRRSSILATKSIQGEPLNDALVPALLASVLRYQIWLSRDEGDLSKALLDRFFNLPPSLETKAEKNALMAQLIFEEAHRCLESDMLLSSLTESTIALPAGASSTKTVCLSAAVSEVIAHLDGAEKMLLSELALVAKRGQVSHIRESAISLALSRAIKSSLGKGGRDSSLVAANLLDVSSAVTLEREMLEAIQYKFADSRLRDDLQWPLITPNGSPLPMPKSRQPLKLFSIFDSDNEDDTDTMLNDPSLKEYWDAIRERYGACNTDLLALSASSEVDSLPHNWSVVHISLTEDKNTLFVSRQEADREPLVFCIPMRQRPEDEEEQYLAFDDAVNELKDIIRASDEGTRAAVTAREAKDREIRAAWWDTRTKLDQRLRILLENIEFCWLGAFKTIFLRPSRVRAEKLTWLREEIDKAVQRSLSPQDKTKNKRQKQKSSSSRCAANNGGSGAWLSDSLLECFSTLSPTCHDEELEDVIYFVLDLYRFHGGVQVALAEVDVTQAAVDLRTALEEYAAADLAAAKKGEKDEHTFLVLDKNVQGVPWESLPTLRGKSVSRVPSLRFLLDRAQLARVQREEESLMPSRAGAVVDPKRTHYVLNPSGDLKNTEGRFRDWLEEMKGVGWTGSIGRKPSEQEVVDALARKDLFIYFGHGGAEQYVRSSKIKHLPRCAATMLWGCSSGALRDMGDFDRVGTPYSYMLAGCPTLVANLWDVTDRDIDKFSQSVFDSLRLTAQDVRAWGRAGANGKERPTSIVAAVARAREDCKLKYLTGAAPVVYGIPFYL